MALLAALIAGAPGCRGEFGLDVDLPPDVRDKAEWIEIGAFKDVPCGTFTGRLRNGVPEGFTARLAFRPKESELPKLGDIPYGKYAFVAAARDPKCAVLAAGCQEVDLGDAESVTIPMTTLEEPSGACGEGASCQGAQCVPANDNADPSVGAGCSLELIGAGPLTKPAGHGTTLSAPAIAPTPDGFVIAYREVDPSGASGRIIILPIDHGGGARKAQRSPLPSACVAREARIDGVGLVVTQDRAMMTLTKPPCAGGAELQMLNFNTTPIDTGLTVGRFFVAPSPNGAPVSMGPARAAASFPGGNVVVFSEDGRGTVATMSAERGIVEPRGSFGGTAGIRGTAVAASDRVLALLAVGGGGEAPSAPDAGPTSATSTVRLLIVPASTPLDAIDAAKNEPRAPIAFQGEWGSIAAAGGRVLVLSDGTGPGRSVSYRAFDEGNDNPVDTGGFSLESGGKVTSGDVTIFGDRAYFAALEEGSVALYAFGGAATRLRPLHHVFFQRETRISAISTVRDGSVAVAAKEGRVAVAWTTARELTKNDATGGYAVFGCTQ